MKNPSPEIHILVIISTTHFLYFFNLTLFTSLSSDCSILIQSQCIYFETEVIPVLFVAELVFDEEFSFSSSICPGLT